MIVRSSAAPWLFALLVLLAGSPAEAQLCLNNWTCSVVMRSCSATGGIPTCTSAGCVCTIPCNNDQDCPARQSCNASGVCQAAVLCNNNRDCRAGDVCNNRGLCETPAPPTPECTRNADCTDDNPCNGIETCDGTRCRRSQPPNCDDGNSATVDSCLREGPNDSYCYHDAGQKKACSEVNINGSTAAILPAQSGRRGFVWKGTLGADFSSKSPYDLPHSRIHAALVDSKGTPLADQILEGEDRWQETPGGGWVYTEKNPGAVIQKLSFGGSSGKGPIGRTFQAEGVIPDKQATRVMALTGVLVVDWEGPDIVGPCGTVTLPVCKPDRRFGTLCREGRP